MNTRRSTGSIKSKFRTQNHNSSFNGNLNGSHVSSYMTKTITPELHAINAKICRLVEKHPCMYDRSHPTYMRKPHLDSAWEDIAREMQDSIESCKERFRNIRTSFARSINVQRGSNRLKPYYLSDELEFLKKHITPGVPVPLKGRRSRDSVRKGEENDENEQEMDEDGGPLGNLVHVKHSVSSDENSTDNSSDWMSRMHAQNVARQAQDKPDSELPSQSDDDEQKPPKELKDALALNTLPIPPKKRRCGVPETTASNEAASTCNTDTEECGVDGGKSAAIDYDDIFLQGLRPEMQQMNFHQKLYFKRRVYELLGDIFEDGSKSSSHPSAVVNDQISRSVATPPPASTPPALQHKSLMTRAGVLQLPKLPPGLPKITN